ncbi:MAG TPA: methionine aminotransferase [Smithella sp.]|nr:methionine aminotransferase [Smithella sp.]HNY50066.1 methionine aminotransferase [Smithella sp.]HOG90244.1 methionine aminotransferase [Smithella sp.]HQG66554.1 methionine aminotransferase [Smithella sp.]HQH17549.1 methionine aminotransferase [Smithella sp.]
MMLHSKLPDVGVTIFTVMSKLANDAGAINLSQGFPDFDVSAELRALVTKYMALGYNQYAPMQGVPSLRQRIHQKTKDLYGASYDPDTEITVTSGATEAIFSAIACVVNSGDEVILFEPAYDAYAPDVLLAGGVPVYVRLKYPDYHIDWNEVKDAITPKTRLLILNSPQNPTGAILDTEDMKALMDIISGTDITIVSDEVYEHIVFDGQRHESMARYPELAARSFVISSFGKTYHTTGWKLGYCLAPKDLSAEFQRVHQFVTFASHTPTQYAYAEFMEKKEKYLTLPDFYQKKRNLFLSLIKDSRFKPLPCLGTYFQMLSYADITDERDIDFAKRLTTEHKVASIPPSVFYVGGDDHKVLRFCFAKKEETLIAAAERLCKI